MKAPARRDGWTRDWRAGAAALALVAGLLASAPATQAQSAVCNPDETLWRVSTTGSGAQANGASSWADISGDGRYVVFSSAATNLVGGDTNGREDVFVFDREACAVERVSVGQGGGQLSRGSFAMDISDSGRFVLFNTRDSAVVAGDTNARPDLFLFDRDVDQVSRVSVGNGGTQANAATYLGALSSDGRYVVFTSDATNLVSGDARFDIDVFLRDNKTSTVIAASVRSGGAGAGSQASTPTVSGNGRYVAFTDLFDDIIQEKNRLDLDVDIFVHDAQSRETTRASLNGAGQEVEGNFGAPSLSADGRYIAFSSASNQLVSGDTNGLTDVFVRDRVNGAVQRVSVGAGGAQANGASGGPSISADGRYVAFSSDATNLAGTDTNGRTDVFVRDLQTGQTARVSLPPKGGESNGASSEPAVSSDGRFVVFLSSASTLVTGDTNGAADVFVARNPLAVPPAPVAPAVPVLQAPANGTGVFEGPVTLTWQSDANALTYELQIDTATPPVAAAVTLTAPSYTLPGIPPLDTSVYWRVRALGGDGLASAWSAVSTFQIVSPPDAAPGINPFTTPTPTLRWGPVSYAVQYEVQVDTDTTFGDPLALSVRVPNSELELTLASPLDDGTYFWRVRAQRSDGTWGPWSVSDTFVVHRPSAEGFRFVPAP